MNKRVLIINRGVTTDNFGDMAINYVMTEMFKDNSAIVHSANYTLFYNRTGSKFISIINNIKEAISIAKKDFDIVVIGGGQLIQSNRSFPISFFLWIVILRIFSRSKLVLFGVGVNDSYTFLDKQLYKFGLKKMDRYYVRDFVSQENLEKIYSINSEIIPDPVFGISFLCSSIERKTDFILFGITEYSSIRRYGIIKDSESEYLRNQAIHILEISKKDKVQLIYNTDSDYRYAVKLQKLLQQTYHLEVEVLVIKNLNDYLNKIRSAKKIISSRMHALIIARSYGVEVEPIVRNQKLLTFKTIYKDISIKDSYEYNVKTVKLILNDS